MQKLRGGTVGELRLQRVEHFVPRQAAAIDHAVGLLEVDHLLRRETGPTQADAVEADDHRRAAVDRDERRHVLP